MRIVLLITAALLVTVSNARADPLLSFSEFGHAVNADNNRQAYTSSSPVSQSISVTDGNGSVSANYQITDTNSSCEMLIISHFSLAGIGYCYENTVNGLAGGDVFTVTQPTAYTFSARVTGSGGGSVVGGSASLYPVGSDNDLFAGSASNYHGNASAVTALTSGVLQAGTYQFVEAADLNIPNDTTGVSAGGDYVLDFTFSSAPEPNALLLLAFPLSLFAGRRRQRRFVQS